ncbi:shufflon system plasmid conjugative transfer pilus tip adhesin PilV [Vogesella indigofera]|uniref:Shufflon system plasmid conjugative transfer pilus tip adhesin PilV n=1 Tax=Vogesella indigofera TaxID=45465 RepID=A0ABT5I8P4_VOGIN|nr:shufflon system plasmid conjugative transfer pilus tip adhesin PilV [Vogesella indigofera]MDC7692559.1 shufflon system plasmid conjugative transfer pilus tip adhesin PilV [Vogesella indigofera]
MRNQSGFTLTEVLLATAVTGSAMAAAYQWMQRSQDDTNLTIAAQHHKMVMEAGAEYIKDHQATVLAGSTATSPYKITVAMLIAAKKLPDGFNPVNNFGQTQCVLVLQPATNNPVQLTVSEGGTELSDFQLARAVMTH